MAQKAEIELKLEAQKSDIRTLAGALERSRLCRQSAVRAESKELVSVYFDTGKLKLRKHGVSIARRRKLFVGGLKSLQDALGELNDIRVHVGVTRDLADRTTRSASSRVFAAGRVSGREEARRAAVLKSAPYRAANVR